MFHDLLRLRAEANLLRLLAHYAALVGEDRMAWQDRLMALAGVDGATLARLHGELIAGDWLEINVGSPTGRRPGAVESSYRVTVAGLRACRHIQSGAADEEEDHILPNSAAQFTKVPRGPRRAKKTTPNDPAPPSHAA